MAPSQNEKGRKGARFVVLLIFFLRQTHLSLCHTFITVESRSILSNRFLYAHNSVISLGNFIDWNAFQFVPLLPVQALAIGAAVFCGVTATTSQELAHFDSLLLPERSWHVVIFIHMKRRSEPLFAA